MGCILSKGFDANNQPVKSVSGGPHYPNFSRGPARFTLMPRITRCAAPGLPSLHVIFTSHPSPFHHATPPPPFLPSEKSGLFGCYHKGGPGSTHYLGLRPSLTTVYLQTPSPPPTTEPKALPLDPNYNV